MKAPEFLPHVSAHVFATAARLACASALCVLFCQAAWAAAPPQSGRRAPAPRSPVPAATPAPQAEPGVEAPGTYSDSGGDKKASTPDDASGAGYSFSLIEDEEDNFMLRVPAGTLSYVMAGFVERMRGAPAVAVSAGGRGSRSDARRRAQAERATFTVLLQLDEDRMSTTQRRAGDPTDIYNLIVRYQVFAPQTAAVKAHGEVNMRPYQNSTRVGGVRLPLPTPRVGSNRVAVEYILHQAGRDAADRVLRTFGLRAAERP